MSLTIHRGPFGTERAGRFDFEPPERVVYVEPLGRRVRAMVGGETVVDSSAALLVHETGSLPHYAFPAEDVRIAADAEQHVDGHVRVAWAAVEAWYEEDERVVVHPRDPYHRIDTYATSRHVVVSVDGVVLADSTRVRALYETSLPVRWYFPAADVRTDLLERSATVTECAYKGRATHWSAHIAGEVVADVAWSYEGEVRREAEAVAGLLAFYDERVDVDVDGAREVRPVTKWSS